MVLVVEPPNMPDAVEVAVAAPNKLDAVDVVAGVPNRFVVVEVAAGAPKRFDEPCIVEDCIDEPCIDEPKAVVVARANGFDELDCALPNRFDWLADELVAPPNMPPAFMAFDAEPMENGLLLLLLPLFAIEFVVGVADPVLYMLITSLTSSSDGFISMFSLWLASMTFWLNCWA